MKKRRPPPGAIRQLLLGKHDGRCAACGITDSTVRLEVAHIVPLHAGGESSLENLTLLCPNCHRSLHWQPREFDFVVFLAEMLEKDARFSDIRQEVVLGGEQRFRADIVATRKKGRVEHTIIVECMTPVLVGSRPIGDAIQQVKSYAELLPGSRSVIAIPATIRDSDKAALEAADVELWDLPTLAAMFARQLSSARSGHYSRLLADFLARPDTGREELLAAQLAECTPGRTDALVYQSLIGDILELLFHPPLGKPIPQRGDESRANIRDYIMPNYAEKGFWAFLRERYQADYIVFDAKNHSKKLAKADVLQIANYLKPHGAGMFGVIVSRAGGDAAGCEHARREQWVLHRKLVIVLDDEDVRAMLKAKSEGRGPEEVIAQKIESFRLSM
jgi:hypothetical protein